MERKINARMLRRVAKHILEEPKRLIMDTYAERETESHPTFFDYDAPRVKKQTFAKCGTAACIAGWTCLLGYGMDYDGNFGDDAAEILHLDSDQRARLFSVVNWPKEFHMQYNKVTSQKKKAEIAVARIEHFIKTKGEE